MNRHPFIVLEGLSGCGKSTIAARLAAETGATLVKTPGPPFDRCRDLIDVAATPTARYCFYLAGLAAAATPIRDMLPTSAVICDRWLATTHAWHALLGVNVLDDYGHLTLPEPDLAVLVLCDEHVRRIRLNRRGRSHNDRLEAEGDREEELLRGYRAWGLTEIDNSSEDPHDAVNAIVALLAANPAERRHAGLAA